MYEPAVVLGAMVGAARSSDADAGVADAAPESGAEKPVVPEEQTTLPEALEGVVGHAVRPSSPLVVPPATDGDEVEEIELRNLALKLSGSSVSGAMKLWWWKRRTPPGKSEG